VPQSRKKLSYVLQLLSALNYLAALTPQVVHRDIKPQNIFVKGGSAVLGDFGLMKLLDGNAEADREIFKESVGPGMPFYYRTPPMISRRFGHGRQSSGRSQRDS
jgi:serine/threonine protein kinase